MYNKFLGEREINVKVGDRVSASGYHGTVTEVLKGSKTDWDGEKYYKVPNSEYTHVRVHFDENSELIKSGYLQYQDGVYGDFKVIE